MATRSANMTTCRSGAWFVMRADILFVPVSGSQGAGELYRCLALASACHQRNPHWQLHLCVSHEAGFEAPAWLHVHELEASPTRDKAGTQTLLSRLAPRVVVFDNSLPRAVLRQAHADGARLIYISSRPARRRRGFDPRKLARLDEHWIIAPPTEHRLTWGERLLRITGRPRLRFFATLASPAGRSRRAGLSGMQDFVAGDYVLFAPGGGGGEVEGHPVAAIFRQAARDFHARTGMATVFIAGPMARVTPESAPGRLELASLAPEALGDVLGGARLVVTGGGSLVHQSLAHGRACLAVAAGGRDQPARLRALAASGVIETCETRPEVMCERAVALAEDESRRHRLVKTVQEAGYVNGMAEAVSALCAAVSDRF